MSDRRHMTGSESAAPPQLGESDSAAGLTFFPHHFLLINGRRHVSELNLALVLISLVTTQNFLGGATTTTQTEGQDRQVGGD